MFAGLSPDFYHQPWRIAHRDSDEKEAETVVVEKEEILDEEEEYALENFYDPIYRTVMENPATLPCLHKFEKRVLKDWIKRRAQHNCPICRKIANWTDVKKEFHLKETIAQWRVKCKEMKDKIDRYVKAQKDLQEVNECLNAQNRQLYNELNHQSLKQIESKEKEKEKGVSARTNTLSFEQVEMTLNNILPLFINSDEERRLELIDDLNYALHFARTLHLLDYFKKLLNESSISVEKMAVIWEQVCPYLDKANLDRLDQTLINLIQYEKGQKNEETIKWLETLLEKGEAEIEELKLKAAEDRVDIQALRNEIKEKEKALNNYRIAIQIAGGAVLFAGACKGAQLVYLFAVNRKGN